MTDKKINIFIALLSIGTPILISGLLRMSPPSIEHNINLNFFPKFNAIVNSTATFFLIFGLIFIKIKKAKWHKMAMLCALFLSCIFLVSYLFYHTFKEEDTKFGGGEGFIRYAYYFILLTHILLSAIILPLVLKTFSFAFITKEYDKHKKWARITFPLWLYVSVTGVLVYLFLAPYY